MSRNKTKLTRINNKRARKSGCQKRMEGLMKKTHELTILCNMTACLIFFSRDENKLVTWPSPEVAKTLLDNYFSLPHLKRNNVKALDQESYIKRNIKTIEKKIADTRKVVMELEMDHLMFELQNGCTLDDLSQPEIENLISYSNKKVLSLRKELGYTKTKSNDPSWGDNEIPRDWKDVAAEWGWDGVIPEGSESIYLMDQWFFTDPEDQNLSNDETHLPKTESGFNLNLKPSASEDKGETSESSGADDA